MERRKTKHQKQNMASNDRLSGLSDDILGHILSFLPTKISVSTSILAKRWRFLWAHVPSLRFEGETSLDVIHRVMVLHKSKTMDTFSLSDMPRLNVYQLETWIITAIDRNVRKLHLLGFKVVLPRCLFTSKTLVDLRLDKCVGTLSGGSPTYMPSLKRLYLHGLMYLDEEALPGLLSGCPVLEELCIINGTMGPKLCRFNISSPSMERFEINFIKCHKPYIRMSINAPKLRYLMVNYSGLIFVELSLSPMTSLIQADLRLFNYNLSTGNLFDCFPNVKCLKLSGRLCKLRFALAAFSFRHFDCLTKLELGFPVDWDELVKFLEIADKLQVLITREVRNQWRSWTEPRKGCLLHSLKTLTIRCFGCTEKELCMLKYVMRNAIVLKRVEIYSRSSDVDLTAKFDTVKRILLFHRGSTECEVAFY